MSVSQAIVVVKGQSPMDLVRMATRAGMEIMYQFDPSRSAYAGVAEHKQFASDFTEWAETGYEQNLYIAEDSDMLVEIELFCNMEGAPTNFIDGESETLILVIGPFDSERIKYFTQNCTKI